jgi:hypothetical protein
MAAPRGNLFALGNTGGRPPIFNTPEEMADKIAEYISWEDENKGHDAKGNGKGLYTLEGCALYLGFASRQSLFDYEQKNDEFSYVINRFKLFLTHWNAQKLYWGGTFSGAQFWLKNWGGYRDESTQNQIVTNVQATFGTAIPTTQQSGDNTQGDK